MWIILKLVFRIFEKVLSSLVVFDCPFSVPYGTKINLSIVVKFGLGVMHSSTNYKSTLKRQL